MIATIGPQWLWHPLGVCVHGPNYQACRSYNLFSGIGSDLQEATLIVSLIVGLFALWRIYKKLRPHLECHAADCHKIGWHRVAGTPYRTCWEDHPVLSQHPGHRVPLEHIRRAHDRPGDVTAGE